MLQSQKLRSSVQLPISCGWPSTPPGRVSSSASKYGFIKAISCRSNVVRQARYNKRWLPSLQRFLRASVNQANAVVATVAARQKVLLEASAVRAKPVSDHHVPRASEHRARK